MSRQRAQFMLDPDRRAEQEAFLRERAEDVFAFGDQFWGSITEEQAGRIAGQGIIVQFHPEADAVVLPAVVFRPPGEIPEVPPDLTATAPTGDTTAPWIVQFIVRPEPDWMLAVAELGAEFIEDLPPQAALFRMTAAQAAQVRALPFVAWLGLYHPAYALDFAVAGREEPFTAETLRELQVAPENLPADPAGNLRLLPMEDIPLAQLRAGVEAAGATVVEETDNTIIANVPVERLREILRVPGLRSAERHLRRMLFNQRAGIVMGANQVRFRAMDFLTNLDGTGETVHVFDSGFDNGAGLPLHPDIAGRVLAILNANGAALPTADFEMHGTHVAGSVGGNGTAASVPPAAATIPRGVAPNCNLILTSVNAALPPDPARNALQARLNFNNYLAAFQTAHNAGARIHNNSWGSDFQNRYNNADSGAIDRFVFLNPEAVVLFSSGNSEGDLNGNGVLEMNSLGPESTPKNIITVGACENDTSADGFRGSYNAFNPVNRFTHANFNPFAPPGAPPPNFTISDNPNHLALFSERGLVRNTPAPTRRRIKPDLVAPGTNIVSLNRIAGVAGAPPMGPAFGFPAVSAPAASYAALSGTSMATPLVSGACALVRQFYRARFGQMRRPQLLEALTAFVDHPVIAPHRDGLVVAWIRRDGGGNQIVAARFSRDLTRLGGIVQLQANVGAQPAPCLARSGANTVLLYRGANNKLRLCLFDAALAPVNAFGTAGVVTLAPDSRAEAERHPALCVRDTDLAVTWHQTGTDNLIFQRFRADTGAALDAAPRTLGSAGATSPQPHLIHNGAQYAVVWTHVNGAQHELLLRFIANDGTPQGAAPRVLVTQAARIAEPHLAWNSRVRRFRAVWISEDVHVGGDVMSQRFNADGSPDPTQDATRVVTVPAANAARRPFLALHPLTGYVLTWEDNQVNSTFDVAFAFLSENGVPDGRVTGNRQPISDTPNDTQGFAAFVDDRGIMSAWLSNDELNSDIRAAFLVGITLQGAFAAQEDPRTPMLHSGRYVPHTVVEHDATTEGSVALVWAGGPSYHLRSGATGMTAELFLIRTNADGLVDRAFANNGARRIDRGIGFVGLSMAWLGTRLACVATFDLDAKVFLFDADGNPENTFGTNGVLNLNERASSPIHPQLGFQGSGNALRLVVAYSRHAAPTPFIRVRIVDRRGNVVVAARDLHAAEGTARHGWFHFVTSDAPARAIAVWHERDVGGVMGVRLNRFNLFAPAASMAQHAAPIVPTALAGHSQNAVLAPRPILFDPPFNAASSSNPPVNTQRRHYGLAWQHQPPPAVPPDPANPPRWRILFSHLNRDGTVGAVADRVVVTSPTDHATDPQLVWHTNGYGLAWLQQPVAGGAHVLFFTLLDANGIVTPAAPHQISRPGMDVQSFQLVWNGRSFRIAWAETQGAVIRHQQSAIALPRTAPPVGFDQPYGQPSAALVRATLINGATNINGTALPNFPSTAAATHNPNDGYGWGRVNLRQALAPAPPVTFHVRDDAAVCSGRIARYEFTLPPNTLLLRVTLVWTDPPGNTIVNNLNLRLTTPAFPPGAARTYVGNRWQPAPNARFSDPLPAPAAAQPFEGIHTVEQIIIPGAPTLPAGTYVVEVIGGPFGTSGLQQRPADRFPAQPFSLVFAGSGNEWPLVLPSTLPGALPFF